MYNDLFFRLKLIKLNSDDPDVPGEVIMLPPSEVVSSSAREQELQVVCLDASSLLGLLIVVVIWAVFDVAHKVYLLIRRAYRRRNRAIKYSVPPTPCNTPVSERSMRSNSNLVVPSLPLAITNASQSIQQMSGIF